MTAEVAVKYWVDGKVRLENMPLEQARALQARAEAVGETVELISPPLVFRDANLSPVRIGDYVRIRGEGNRLLVKRLFQDETGEQIAEITPGGPIPPVLCPLKQLQVDGRETPRSKAERFLELLRRIVRSYGQELNERTDVRAHSTRGQYPGLLIKSGASPVPGLPYVIAVAYDRKSAHAHALIVPPGHRAAGFPLYLHLGSYTARHLLDADFRPAAGFDEAQDRLMAWADELEERGYVAPKDMPSVEQDEVYDTLADAETQRPILKALGAEIGSAFRQWLGPKTEKRSVTSGPVGVRRALDYALHRSGRTCLVELTAVIDGQRTHHQAKLTHFQNAQRLSRYRLTTLQDRSLFRNGKTEFSRTELFAALSSIKATVLSVR